MNWLQKLIKQVTGNIEDAKQGTSESKTQKPPQVVHPTPQPESIRNLADWAEQWLRKGIVEVTGASSHPQILEWLKKTEALYPTDLKKNDDTYAWCGVFVGNGVLDLGGKPPAYFQRALNWVNYGRPVGKKDGRRGDVLVVTRGKNLFHVTIISEVQKDGYLCTGGNQGNRVSKLLYTWDKIHSVQRK
jgi:uncharacterized protein (TIGR02594 family)